LLAITWTTYDHANCALAGAGCPARWKDVRIPTYGFAAVWLRNPTGECEYQRRCSVTLVSRGADYAVRAALDVASQPADGRTVTGQIARRQDIPVAFLSKVVAQLTQAGVLRTHRGAAGGVYLGRSAEEINLLQIIEAVQGPIVINDCTGPYNGCPRADSCPACRVFEEAQRLLHEALREATLADLTSAARH
jgi:Rrf2 family protein